MLIDSKGREVRAESLPKNPKARSVALAALREVPVVTHRRDPAFHLGARATLRENAK